MSCLSQNVMDTHTDRHLANLYKTSLFENVGFSSNKPLVF